MKRQHIFYLLAVIVLVSCGSSSSSGQSSLSSSSSSSASSVSSSESSSSIDINALLNDTEANGTFTSGTNVNRVPEDDLYDQVNEKKRILDVGETYVEGFENSYLQTKISPYRTDNGATYSIVSTGNAVINGKSLYLVSEGDYQGVYFNGMKFAKNSTYVISFKYKIIVASNDFFFQMRSVTGGVPTDIYTTISGSAGEVRTQEATFNLGDYADYQISLFPRNNRGSIAIDDISITRLNSKPQIISASIDGLLTVDSTITYSYVYRDAEGDLEDRVEAFWFSSLDRNGLNMTRLSANGAQLTLTESMIGKYIGVSLRPYAVGSDAQSIGEVYRAYSVARVNNVTPNVGSPIFLDFNESFIEDYETDVDVVGNAYFVTEEGANAYITSDASQIISGSQSLLFNSPGNHKALFFSGINFGSRGIYTLSFKYKFLSKGTQLYVQFRTPSSDYSHDKYVGIDLAAVNLNEVYTFSSTFGLDGYSDYMLMMFPSVLGCEIVIDEVTFTRQEGYNVTVENVHLGISESVFEDFEDAAAPVLGFDYVQTPNSRITSEAGLAIMGRSLYFESPGYYQCLFINRGVSYESGVYQISFKYRVLEIQDTIYVQIHTGSDMVYHQFGLPSQIGQTLEFSEDFAIGTGSNYLIQIFPGGSVGATRVIIDDIMILRKG